jgi:hypothetical protein
MRTVPLDASDLACFDAIGTVRNRRRIIRAQARQSIDIGSRSDAHDPCASGVAITTLAPLL